MTATAPLTRQDAGAGGVPDEVTPARPGRRGGRFAPLVVLALISYVPLLLQARGKIGADTKAYLYLDPGTMLARAVSMWDPHVGMGTVTHENIGYLLPMGPWFWIFHVAHVPTWVAQRLWTGSLLFFAGAGVLYLLHIFGMRRWIAFVAALGYALSPYLLEYEARTSVILLPWAGLGWLIGLSVQALREPRGWRYPARFALVICLIGGINATALIYAGLGPALWIPFAVWGYREVTWRQALWVVVKACGLSLLVSLWWIIGLVTQAGYGLDVLKYTETVATVATTSHPGEILRGLGNWYFYGTDRVSPWVQPSVRYLTSLPVLIISFVVPLAALAFAAAQRWALRGYMAVLVGVGTLVAVGIYPYNHPSPLGSVAKKAQDTSIGLALRSTPRATPLVALGLSVLLAAGLSALWDLRRSPAVAAAGPRWWDRQPLRARWVAPAATVLAVGLVAANMNPLWTGTMVDKSLQAPENVPAYWKQAAAAMNAEGGSQNPGGPQTSGNDSATRVLELPGADFSYYRWGTTADPVTPGLMNRPFVGRELTPYGTAGSAALVRAIDRRLQQGIFEPGGLPDLARLMGVGDIDLRSDLQYERFRTPQPVSTWQMFDKAIAGLGAPQKFGPPVQEDPVVPLMNEITLADPPNAQHPPAVAVFPVQDPTPIVHAERVDDPLLVDGDSEGLVDASAAGLLQGAGTVLYSASQTNATRAAAIKDGADLLITDSNRKQAQRWGTLRDNFGYTEQAGQKPDKNDTTDARLPVFPTSAGDNFRTVAVQEGVTSVTATGYGNPVSYVPADRPAMAFDGDPTTAWRVGAFADVRGQSLTIKLGTPTRTGSINLVQPITGQRSRYLTRVGVKINGGPEQSVGLGPVSRTPAGQTVTFPVTDVRTVQIVLHDTNTGVQSEYTGDSGVGFGEVRIGDRSLNEVMRMPTSVLAAAGASSQSHRLTLLVDRDRADPADAVAEDSELNIKRQFTLPTARSFSVVGTARLSAAASDENLDRSVGRAAGSLTDVESSVRLPGLLTSRATSAFDGNKATAWTTIFGEPAPQYVQATTSKPVTADHMDLSVIADGRHSVPTQITLIVDGKQYRTLNLPTIPDGTTPNGTGTVHLTFKPVSGKKFRVVIDKVRPALTIDYFSKQPYDEPAAIAEVGIPGVQAGAEPATMPGTCRSDLVFVDGHPVPVRVTGTTSDAEGRQGLSVTGCGTTPLRLPAGTHELSTAQGRNIGIDVDRLVLSSAPGGAAAAVAAPGRLAPAGAASTAAQPRVAVASQGETSYKLHISGATPGKAFWLVLGQSQSDGWQAKVTGSGGSTLPHSQLVDAYANGWQVTPPAGRTSFDVTLTWTPQRLVWICLAITAVALLVVLVLCVAPVGLLRRRRRRPASAAVSLVKGSPSSPGADAAVFGPFEAPVLDAPWSGVGARPGPVGLVGVALLLGVVGGAVSSPVGGLVTLVLAAAALLHPRGRLLLRAGSVVCLAVSCLRVVYAERRYHLPADFQWAQTFYPTTTWAWLGVILLVADIVVGAVRRRAASAPPADPGADAD